MEYREHIQKMHGTDASLKKLPICIKKEIKSKHKEILSVLKRTGKYIFISEYFDERVTWDIMMDESRKYTEMFIQRLKIIDEEEKKRILFVILVPNYKNIVQIISSQTQYNLILVGKTKATFYDASFIDTFPITSQMECVDVNGYGGILLNKGEVKKFHSPLKLEPGYYEVEGCLYKKLRYKKLTPSTEETVLFTDAKEYVRKIDITKILKKLNSFDDIHMYRNAITGDKICSDEEFWIIWSSLFGLKGEQGVNLILASTVPQVGKSGLLSIFSKIFDESEVSGTQIREKGLFPSFYGNEVKPGVFMGANFIVLINEVFRYLEKQSGNASKVQRKLAFRDALQSFTEIFERQPRLVVSGKENYKFVYDKGFLSTSNLENLRYINAVWNDESFVQDRAPIIRLSILLLSDITSQAGVTMSSVGLGEVPERVMSFLPLNLMEMRNLCYFIKDKLQYASFDDDKIVKYLQRMEIEKRASLRNKFRHLVRVVAVTNSIIEHRSSYIPKSSDYELAYNLTLRLDEDFEKTVSFGKSDSGFIIN